jgi:hypothetical protein
MSELDESKQVFKEYYTMLAKANEVKNNPEMPQRAIMIEYMKLTEGFEKLLKTSVRISKMGDKAQKKLFKYKELMDTLRNFDE